MEDAALSPSSLRLGLCEAAPGLSCSEWLWAQPDSPGCVGRQAQEGSELLSERSQTAIGWVRGGALS
jgi:hypothetical protein